MSLTDAIQTVAAKNEAVVVVEPPNGLTALQRAAVQEAVNLMAAGRIDEANSLLDLHGFYVTAHRVEGGKLVDLDG